MNKRLSFGLIVSLVTVVICSLFLAGCRASTGSPSSAPKPVSAPDAITPVSSAPAPAPGGEGIIIHGHWLIEVHNQDGSLVEKREFENALTDTGKTALVYILSKGMSVNTWSIVLASQVTGNSAFVKDGQPVSGSIVESSSTSPFPNYFKNLTFSTPDDPQDPNYRKFVLRGTATAQRDGIIDQVITSIYVNISGGGSSQAWFTETILTQPINLLNGQQVVATVIISFS